MRNKLIFLAGVGAGYVLGARAGRERYEQITRAARQFRENPTVQEAAGIVQAQTSGLVTSAKDVVTDKFGHTAIGTKVGNLLGQGEKALDGSYAGSNGVPAASTSARTEPGGPSTL